MRELGKYVSSFTDPVHNPPKYVTLHEFFHGASKAKKDSQFSRFARYLKTPQPQPRHARRGRR